MLIESSLQISLLVLALISLSYISWRKSDLGIYLIIFFLPVYLFRLEILSMPTTALELMIYTVFLVWLLKKFIINRTSDTMSCRLPRSFCIPILLLFAGTIISTLISSDIRTSLGILKGWFIDPLFLFLVIINYIKTKKQIKNILFSFVLSGAAIGIISIFYWIIPSLEGITYDMRLKGFYLSPNHLSMTLAPILLIAYGFFLSRYKYEDNSESEAAPPRFQNYLRIQKKKIFWAFCFLIISIPLYFTYSYGAWLGIIAGIIFISFWLFSKIPALTPPIMGRTIIPPLLGKIRLGKKIFRNSKYKILSWFNLIAILIAGCLLFIVIFSSQLQTEKFQGIFDERSSLQSRIMIWQASSEILKDNFLFGIGPGNFQRYYLAYQPKFPPYLEWAVPQPHNIFLAFWLQCGLIGFIGFIWIIILFFKKGFKILKKDESSRVRLFACILISQMIHILVHGLVDTPYWKNDLSIMFWVTIGLMIVIDLKSEKLSAKKS